MYQIGVDIGGTNIKVGLVSETLELLQSCSVRFPHDGARSVVKTIEEAVNFLLQQQNIPRGQLESVGIVVPGSIDQTGERVIDAYNLGFHDVPLKALVQEAFEGVPVYLANDANGAALAELYAGAFRGCRTAVLLTLGTGLGGGIILNGKMFNRTGARRKTRDARTSGKPDCRAGRRCGGYRGRKARHRLRQGGRRDGESGL